MWHQKYQLPCTKVVGFVSCRVTSNFLGIGEADHSWGDVKTIRSGKRSNVSSDVSEKHSIVYTYACIESDRIEQYHSDIILILVVPVILGMKTMMLLINIYQNRVRKKYFYMNQNMLQYI